MYLYNPTSGTGTFLNSFYNTLKFLVLDLNADFFKSKMKILNPTLLSDKQKQNILDKFAILSKRTIQDFTTEYTNADRIEFDRAVLTAFCFDTSSLPQLYSLLTDTIRNRIEMKDR